MALRHELRALFRNTAQPVAVITSFIPRTEPDIQYHGATLSLFASIAMEPHPLVAFALRVPSSMATSLKAAQPELPSHMVNLLSSEQSAVAVAFSRPDLHPRPFTNVPYTLTKDGLPVIQGSLGAISCKLVSTALSLHDLNYLEQMMQGKEVPEPFLGKESVAPELFTARVTRGHTDVIEFFSCDLGQFSIRKFHPNPISLRRTFSERMAYHMPNVP